MKKFTKICLVLAAILGGTGIILCGVATAFGGNVSGGSMQAALEKAGFYDEEDGFHIGFAKRKGSESVEYSFAAGQIKNLEITCDMADITLQKEEDGTEVLVSMENGYEKYFTCKMDGDTLQVEYDVKGASFDEGPKITVSVPEEMQPDTVDMDCDMGNITVQENALICDSLTLSCNMGNIKVSQATVKKYLEMECDMGNCTFLGTAEGDIVADTDMGNIDLTIYGRYEDYDYTVSCDMGSIEIDGEKYNDLNKKVNIENTGANGKMKLSSSMGSITVDFK